MDGTGKNVKMKRKANEPENAYDLRRREGYQARLGVIGSQRWEGKSLRNTCR